MSGALTDSTSRSSSSASFTARLRSEETVATRSTAWANSAASTSSRLVLPSGITRA